MDIVARAKNMLVSPKTEWQAAAAETSDAGGLYGGYIAPLAAIPAIVIILKSLVWGAVGLGVLGAILTFVFDLFGVFIVAFIAAKLAPTFGGRDSVVSGLKLSGYASTARWIGSIFRLVPFVGWIVSLVLSIYGLYLFYLGATPTMGVPQERAVPYTVAIVIAAIIVVILISLIVGSIVGIGMMGDQTG